MIALTSSNYLPLAASLIVVLVDASSASVTSNAYENIAFQDRTNSDNTQFVKIYNTYDAHNFLPLRNGQKLFAQSDACPIGKLSIWFDNGGYSYVPFMQGLGANGQILSVKDDQTGSTIVLGADRCSIKVTVERN